MCPKLSSPLPVNVFVHSSAVQAANSIILDTSLALIPHPGPQQRVTRIPSLLITSLIYGIRHHHLLRGSLQQPWGSWLLPVQMLPPSPQRSPVKTASTESSSRFSSQNPPSEFHLTQSQKSLQMLTCCAHLLPFISSPPPHSTRNHHHTAFYHSNKPSTLRVSTPCAWNTIPPDLYRVALSPSSVRLSLNTLHCFQSTYDFLIDCIFYLIYLFLVCFQSPIEY